VISLDLLQFTRTFWALEPVVSLFSEEGKGKDRSQFLL
jgi:hypothetical protein